MSNIFELGSDRAEPVSDTSEMALSRGEWAPGPAPLEVPRQTLERRQDAPAWLALMGRIAPRNA